MAALETSGGCRNHASGQESQTPTAVATVLLVLHFRGGLLGKGPGVGAISAAFGWALGLPSNLWADPHRIAGQDFGRDGVYTDIVFGRIDQSSFGILELWTPTTQPRVDPRSLTGSQARDQAQNYVNMCIRPDLKAHWVKELLASELVLDKTITIISADMVPDPTWWGWVKEGISTHKDHRKVLKLYADHPFFSATAVAALTPKETQKLLRCMRMTTLQISVSSAPAWVQKIFI